MSFTRTLRVVGCAVVAGALLFGTAPVASADQIREDQWPLKAFEAESVWKESTGKGVTVAVIDNGVDGTHPDLEGNVLPGKDFVNGGRADRETTGGHATGMAAIIAGHGHGPGGSDGVKGLAPDAKILPIKKHEESGEEFGKVSYVPQAIKYAVDHGADVVNMSFAGSALSDEEKLAIDYAIKRDVLLVASSGNERSDNKNYPAAAPGVVGVGAVDKSGTVWRKSNYGSHLMLTAPGTYIRSAGVETPYRLTEGTSDSTAYVSAAAALLRSKFPDLTAGQIVNRLVKTAGLPASEKGTSLPDPHYGYGFIRPYSALTEDIPAGPKNGPLKVPKSASSASKAPDGANSDTADDQASKRKKKSLPIAVIGIGVGLLVVGAIVAIVVIQSRKNRRNGPPPGGPGGPGGYGPPGGAPGYPPQPYPYQQPVPPGAYPPGPPPNYPRGQ